MFSKQKKGHRARPCPFFRLLAYTTSLVIPKTGLGLVTKALLMTVRLHALSALVLADFCLTTFFQASHGIGLFGCLVVRSANCWRVNLEDNLGEWILDDSFCAELLEIWNNVASHGIFDHAFNSDPTVFGEVGDRRTAEGG